jgi:hypothetical protein
MSFVYPQFLFGLLALGIPIIIHLFNFRRAKKVYFSSNQFLLNIKKATKTKLKIKHLLILISRLLFIFFLVITFAQPFIPAKEKNIQSNQAIIYLDNSYSMSNYVDEDQSAFEAAISYIEKIIDIYPQNSEFLLLTNDFAPYSNTPKSKNEIEELITEINLTGISRSIEEILLRIKNQATTGITNDVYWLTDFQKSTAGELVKLTNDTTFNNFLMPLSFSTALNVYVDSLYLSNPFLIHSEKNKLNVVLRNDSDEYIEDLLIKLSINDIQSANGSLSIDPYSAALITFDLNMKLDKFNYGSISFEDFPVTFDNEFYFALTLSDRIFITELKDSDSTTVIEKVFGNQSLFNFQSYISSNIDYNDLLKSDLIILNELDNLEVTISNILSDFNNKKGDLLLIPSSDFNVSSFLSVTGPVEIIPDSLRTTMVIDNLDLNNPFFTDIFEDRENQFNMPSAKPAINISGTNESIMKFKDGRDFLSYQQKNNRLYFLASPFRIEYTDFYTHAIYVPIMYRIAMLSKKEFNRIYYTLDESVIKVTTDSINTESIIKLKSMDKEIVPETRIAGNELILDIPKFELNPAHYDIEIENVTKGTIAFNPDKSESLLEQYTIENLRESSSENSYVKLFNTKGFDNFDKEIKEKYLGIPLWRITLILALIFLLIEILLIRFL